MNSLLKVDARRWTAGLFALTLVSLIAAPTHGGEPYRFRGRWVAETRFAPRTVIQGSESLGTFEPTPYVNVRGNGTAGGGYSPLGSYGDTTLAMYGPLSAFRTTTAPVTTYTRGYDGVLHAEQGISFSTPNLPALSPVVYPTRSSYYYRARLENGPPIRPRDSMNWIDQN